jgi:uncharacterized protein (DUF1810 family)
MADDANLSRFVEAQEGTYATALAELRRGRKRSHWMWFVFPQFEGLGSSEMSRRYAIRSLEEASAYLAHPVLGPRIEECAAALLLLAGFDVSDILPHPDDLKLRSSMTLFELVAPPGSVFARVLDAHFRAERDEATLRAVGRQRDSGTRR